MATLSTKAFVLEQLEPRLLLSATALDTATGSPPPSEHVAVVSQESAPVSAPMSHDFLGYTPASQINDIFDGLTPVQELAQNGNAARTDSASARDPGASPTQSLVSPESQTPIAPTAAPSWVSSPLALSAPIDGAEPAVSASVGDSVSSVVEPASGAGASHSESLSTLTSPATAGSNAVQSVTDQLTETLRVANAPPASAVGVQSVISSLSSTGSSTSAARLPFASSDAALLPPLTDSSASESFSYLGHAAQFSAAHELRVFATGEILLSALRPDLLRQQGIRSLVIQGSDSTDDTLVVDLAQGDVPLDVTFNGGVGAYDTLKVSGVNGGNYTPGKVFGDGVFTSGVTRVAFTGLEPVILDGSLPAPSVVSGAATAGTTNLAAGVFTFTTPSTGGGDDLITIDSPSAGQNRISGTSGGVAFENVTFKNIAHVIIDTGTNDKDGANTDSVKLISPLVAIGLLDLKITTGAGDDVIDLSQSGAVGAAVITVDGGAGSDTFINAGTGAVALTDAS
ncbi:MAG: LEPR-XLL domain-containing protein, partial [Verrucomicrobia bacterium]|nr:LEPR-XLL domain-containing protein [Verrucomicrobiota bacterium]